MDDIEGSSEHQRAAQVPAPPPVHQGNLAALSRAHLRPDITAWLGQVVAQVDRRLDRVNPRWRDAGQEEAARACAFGLLLGHLAARYPHVRGDLARVAEAHPSFTTLLSGSRLATLEQIAAEPTRMAAWLGPLVDAQDPRRVQVLLD